MCVYHPSHRRRRGGGPGPPLVLRVGLPIYLGLPTDAMPVARGVRVRGGVEPEMFGGMSADSRTARRGGHLAKRTHYHLSPTYYSCHDGLSFPFLHLRKKGTSDGRKEATMHCIT